MKSFNQLFINPYLLVLVILSGISCSKPMMDPIITQEPKVYSYLALGDSYTIGHNVSPSLRWPIQLQDSLNTERTIISEVNVIAQTGWTTTDLLQAIEQNNPDRHDLVSLLIGVNNQYQGLPFAEFQLEFDSLLQTAQDLAKLENGVFVVSIPDYGVTPFGSSNSQTIAMELDNYNAYMSDQCSSRNIPFIDITEISRTLGDNEGALASDNLHPSGLQYSEWVEAVLPDVRILLND